MNKKFKQLLTASLIATTSLTAVGCGTANSKLAKNIDKGMADFVSSLNNLDYIDTGIEQTSSDKIGKIIETSNTISNQYLTQTLEELNADDAITLPNERTDNFKLFTLSNLPYISFTSDDNNASLNVHFKFSTNKLNETSNNINSNINNLILKRSILMIYVNEIYNNKVDLSNEDRVAINAYLNVIKENTSFLNGNRGMVKNQLTLASDLVSNKSNDNLVNYYIIKSGEALETRSNKIDSAISAIDSIIDIIEANLTTDSIYYNKNLSATYEDIFSSINNPSSITTEENKTLAENITSSLNFISTNNNNDEFKIGEVSNIEQNTKNLNAKNNLNLNKINNVNTKKSNSPKTLELKKNNYDKITSKQNDLNQKTSKLVNPEQRNQFNNESKNQSYNSIQNQNNTLSKKPTNDKNQSLSNNHNYQKNANNDDFKSNNVYNLRNDEVLLNSQSKNNQMYSINNQNHPKILSNKTQYNSNNMSNFNRSSQQNSNREIIKTVPYIQNID